MTEPMQVLFVCTANISRSPYAERRARQVLQDWDVELASAGVPGYPGRAMDPAMEALLVERGGDSSGHVSRAVDEDVLAKADLVLTFEFGQHMKLLDGWPEAAGKVLGVGQLARAAARLRQDAAGFDSVEALVRKVVGAIGVNSMSYDVEDPYQRGQRAALVCADEIDRHLDAFLPLLAGADLPQLAASHAGEPEEAPRRWWVRRRRSGAAPRRAAPPRP